MQVFEFPHQVVLNRYVVKRRFFFLTRVTSEIAAQTVVGLFREITDARDFARMKNRMHRSPVVRAVVFTPELDDAYGRTMIPDIHV